jgi:predicted dehydrogenase
MTTGHNASDGALIRYAVVGLGYIAQNSVLPAFRRTRDSSRLTALVSDDPVKLRDLGEKYGVGQTYSYEQYDECLRSGDVDAVFICLPNSMHREYSVRAAQAGLHVLCEKPMAVSASECQEMIQAAREASVRLMIAYRLHLEPANLAAIEVAQSGKLGELRIFSSTFTMQVKAGNTRLSRELGGGNLWDIGIYCINAARYLFRAEPYEVFALSANGGDPRFAEVAEMTSAVLRFPGERLATFTSSFGAADTSTYTLIGTEGSLRADPAYEHASGLGWQLRIGDKTTRHRFPKVNQFAAELKHFSDCIVSGVDPKVSGKEGLADVRIIEALHQSVETGQPVPLDAIAPPTRPDPANEIRLPASRKQKLVHAESPSEE